MLLVVKPVGLVTAIDKYSNDGPADLIAQVLPQGLLDKGQGPGDAAGAPLT